MQYIFLTKQFLYLIIIIHNDWDLKELKKMSILAVENVSSATSSVYKCYI